MIKITIDDRGARRMLEGASKKLRDAASEGFAQGGEMITATARSIAPVRTGALRASIYYALAPFKLILGAGVNYAAYVEYGTSRMAPRPFLRPAIWSHLNDVIGAIKRALG